MRRVRGALPEDAPELWTPANEAYVRAVLSTGPAPRDRARREARKLYHELLDLMHRIEELGAEYPDYRDGCTVFLAEFAAAALERRELRSPVKHYGADGAELPFEALWALEPEPAWPPRVPLVANWDEPGHWWWLDRRPSATELAVLSVLGGSWPDACKGSRLLTPAEAIKAEARNIEHARRYLGLKPPSKEAQ